MSEFNDRIAVQRQILQIINRNQWDNEELLGLSRKAIERWISVNQINSESKLTNLVKIASSKLFFLSNKSQEQITEKYNIIYSDIMEIIEKIEIEIKKIAIANLEYLS
jgi:hypothetical protein